MKILLLLSTLLSAVVVRGQDSSAITDAFGACVNEAGVDFACIQGAITALDLDPSLLADLASCASTDLNNIDIQATTACVQQKLASLGGGGGGDDQDEDEQGDDPDSSVRLSATLAIAFTGLAMLV